MATKYLTPYEIISNEEYPVVSAGYVGYGDDRLDDVIEGINDFLETHEQNIGNITTRVTANEGSITELDTRVTALEESGGGGGGTNNYNELINIPSVNGVSLKGNLSAANLGLANAVDIPTVPTNVSAFTNDAGYLTQEQYTGTVTSVAVKMNGNTKGTVTSSGTIDLGTVITSHQSLANYVPTTRKVNGKALSADVTLSAYDVSAASMSDIYNRCGGGKNLLKVDNVSTSGSTEIFGVTYKLNSDGSVTVNGTATQDSNCYLSKNGVVLPAGKYVTNGCPSGGNASTGYSLYNGMGFDIGSGRGDTRTTSASLAPRIIVRKGCTVNNLVFKPMIRYAETSDTTFVKYIPTNEELYEMIKSLMN